jgi:hypothetical protein
VREGYAEVQVDAGLWKGRPRRWWHDPADASPATGMTGQALVDWVHAMAARYPANVRLA